MRRNLKAATNLGQTHSCLTTTLAWIYGPSGDPAISVRLDQISEWIDLWSTFSYQKRLRVKKAWTRLLPQLGLDGEEGGQAERRHRQEEGEAERDGKRDKKDRKSGRRNSERD